MAARSARNSAKKARTKSPGGRKSHSVFDPDLDALERQFWVSNMLGVFLRWCLLGVPMMCMPRWDSARGVLAKKDG